MLQNFTLGSFAQGVSAGGGAFESIASATGTGSSGTITFSSIPSTYQSLQIRITARTTTNTSVGGLALRATMNGDTSASYVFHWLTGNGTAASAYNSVGDNYIWTGILSNANYTSDVMATTIIDIHDYASTSRNKTLRAITGVNNNATSQDIIRLVSGLWLNTSAITSLTFTNNAGDNFTTSSTFALYGIKGA